MPRACTVCTHTQRHTIERDLADAVSLRTIAQRYTLSKSAVMRHQHQCAPLAVRVPVVLPDAPPRPPLSPERAAILRQELERVKDVITEDVRLQHSERYLCYVVGILLKLIDALSTSRPA